MIETLALIRQGGWPMIPLALCSVVALTIIFERAWALRRNRVINPGIIRLLEGYTAEEAAAPALVACQRDGHAFARIIAEVIRMRQLEHDQAIERMHAVGRTEVGRLDRGLTLLEIVAGISPLIGLLGTVIGMVEVFDAITAQGLGDPQVLSDGISKALITTIAGLCVAIPALAFHGVFSKRVEDLATEMQDRATSFIIKLQNL